MRKLLAVLVLWVATPLSVQAEQMRDYGEFVVQYSAMHSVDLSPQIAREYGVTRSAKRGLLMITVQQKIPGQSVLRAIPARVSGVARNVTGQVQALDLRELREGGTLYYLAEVAVENLDLMTFDLRIVPGDSGDALPLQFQQRFYVDD